ncbi:oligosaccharide flippase family protein [Rhodovulum steppense]|nr:oligosaccharide flippase family protein [Rhodovulum steppense]
MAFFFLRPPHRLSSLLRGDSLKARAARSTLWTLGEMLSHNVLRLASNLVLTRLLFPEAFGLMALIQVFLTGMSMMSDTGFGPSIIQNNRSREPAFLNTAWTLQVLRGLLLWLLACAFAWPLAAFYDDPRLAQMLPVAGLAIVISGFNPTRIYTANRDLVMGRLTIIRITAQVLGILIMVALAILLHSVWALVIGSLASAAISLALFHYALPGHRDRFQIERTAFGELFHFGKWIFISSAAGFMVNHADRAILGKFITLEMLGIYTVGFFLASVPLLLGRPLASKIVFPLYKQRPTWESAENRRKIFYIRWRMTGGLLGLSAILAMSGTLLVDLLYDPRYALAGPIMVLLSISQMPMVILSSYGSLMLAAGDSRRYADRIIATAIVQTTLLIVGVRYFGIVGAVAAPGLAALIVYPILVNATRRYAGWDRTHDLVYGALAVAIAAIAIWLNADSIGNLITFSQI